MALAVRGMSTFDAVTRGLRSVMDIAGSVAGVGGGATGGGQISLSPEYQNLLETQIQINQEMTTVSLQTNIEKAKHDSRMSVVRNVRVQ